MAVLATDSALPFMYERYQPERFSIDIYYRLNDKWRLSEHTLPQRQDVSAFSSANENGFAVLISSMTNIIREISPDVILRTTPATHYGIDEAVAEAVKEAGTPCRMLCYQDYYGCGHALKNFNGTILTLDKEASHLLLRDGIRSIPIGWLSMLNYLQLPSYSTVREKTRCKLHAEPDQILLLYCMTASGDIDAESEIFSRFLSRNHENQKQRLFIKTHPRNSKAEIQRYLALLKNTSYETADTLRYEEVLAFPDYIISPASAVNVDALSYQICNGLHELKTISVYTEGVYTCRLIQKATGYSSLAPGRRGNGSLIAEENFRGTVFNQPERDMQRRLFQEAKNFLGGNINEIIEAFMKHLEWV